VCVCVCVRACVRVALFAFTRDDVCARSVVFICVNLNTLVLLFVPSVSDVFTRPNFGFPVPGGFEVETGREFLEQPKSS